jgi:hypothetical protein
MTLVVTIHWLTTSLCCSPEPEGENRARVSSGEEEGTAATLTGTHPLRFLWPARASAINSRERIALPPQCGQAATPPSGEEVSLTRLSVRSITNWHRGFEQVAVGWSVDMVSSPWIGDSDATVPECAG